MAFSDGPGTINVAATTGSVTPTPLTQGDSPSYSPDGQAIAFGRDGSVWKITPDGTHQRNLAAGGEPNWAPKERRGAPRGSTETPLTAATTTTPRATGLPNPAAPKTTAPSIAAPTTTKPTATTQPPAPTNTNDNPSDDNGPAKGCR